jgi:hypothetical protein
MVSAWRAIGFGALVLACTGGEAPAQAAEPQALVALAPGLWEFKEVGRTGAPTRRCLTSLRELFQPVHPTLACRHFISADEADHATVAYDCAALGQGRTSLRVETRRLVQLDSQGISEGRPFAVRLEARRLSACKPTSR